MSRLTHLADEICAGSEIYFTGRTGDQYFKSAFILCDDYTELASKLYLMEHNQGWSDGTGRRHRSYHQVLSETLRCLADRAVADEVANLQPRMRERREMRNGFFHSADLLNLNLSPRTCVEAYCDLFRYCELLFGSVWQEVIPGARNLSTLVVLFRLERVTFSRPEIASRIADILREQPRNLTRTQRTGVHVTVYPEDLHLRMCIISGGNQLRDQLSELLTDCLVEDPHP